MRSDIISVSDCCSQICETVQGAAWDARYCWLVSGHTASRCFHSEYCRFCLILLLRLSRIGGASRNSTCKVIFSSLCSEKLNCSRKKSLTSSARSLSLITSPIARAVRRSSFSSFLSNRSIKTRKFKTSEFTLLCLASGPSPVFEEQDWQSPTRRWFLCPRESYLGLYQGGRWRGSKSQRGTTLPWQERERPESPPPPLLVQQ